MIEPVQKKLHVTFSGQVQGIGFRANVKNWADGLALTGWVRNNPDGTVEVEAEGEEEKLREILQTINSSHLKNYITKTETFRKPAENKYQRFDIA